MAGITRILAASAAIAVALSAFAPAAEARHHGHHAHAKMVAALVPAHQRADYVGDAAVPGLGLIDLGLGPVFPFGGWPK